MLERVAGARLVYDRAVMTRVISFEYLNRTLVWQELSELLLFALPLFDLPKIRAMLASVLPRLPSPSALLAWPRGATVNRIESEPEGRESTEVTDQSLRPAAPCPICACPEILLPYTAWPCGHVFCYYCLRANCEADVAFSCPLDGRRVASMRRLRKP